MLRTKGLRKASEGRVYRGALLTRCKYMYLSVVVFFSTLVFLLLLNNCLYYYTVDDQLCAAFIREMHGVTLFSTSNWTVTFIVLLLFELSL